MDTPEGPVDIVVPDGTAVRLRILLCVHLIGRTHTHARTNTLICCLLCAPILYINRRVRSWRLNMRSRRR
jgi:hypothetical protein